jgi:excisionase family DNA binding protein
MPVTEQDFITLQEAAKRLNIALDQVMFMIEEGRFPAFYEPPE